MRAKRRKDGRRGHPRVSRWARAPRPAADDLDGWRARINGELPEDLRKRKFSRSVRTVSLAEGEDGPLPGWEIPADLAGRPRDRKVRDWLGRLREDERRPTIELPQRRTLIAFLAGRVVAMRRLHLLTVQQQNALIVYWGLKAPSASAFRRLARKGLARQLRLQTPAAVTKVLSRASAAWEAMAAREPATPADELIAWAVNAVNDPKLLVVDIIAALLNVLGDVAIIDEKGAD